MDVIEHKAELVDQGAVAFDVVQTREYQLAITNAYASGKSAIIASLIAQHREAGNSVFIVSGRERALEGGDGSMMIVDEAHLVRPPELDERIVELEARKRRDAGLPVVGGGNNRKERRAWLSRKGDPVPEHQRPDKQAHAKTYFKGNFRT